MIVDKRNNKVISGNKDSSIAKPPPTPPEQIVAKPMQVEENGPMAVLSAIKEILKSVTWEWGAPDSPAIFQTVQIDDGQYERIISPNGNMEETIGLPAAFIHFTDWHYLVQQAKINEGRATLRIRFILNSLNIREEGRDMDVYYVAERVNQSIQENIANYPCLQERCRLQYVDPMESFDHTLQPCWLTYEIWFKQRNIWISRNKVYKKIVCPPFTNHADQTHGEGEGPENHTNLNHPQRYDDMTGFIKAN